MSDIICEIKKSLQQSLNEFADKQIEKLVGEFRCELERRKTEIVGRLINDIEIGMAQDSMGHTTIQINIRSGR